jgi:hypothetical protein
MVMMLKPSVYPEALHASLKKTIQRLSFSAGEKF